LHEALVRGAHGRRGEPTDAAWKQIAPLLPGNGHRGRAPFASKAEVTKKTLVPTSRYLCETVTELAF
jgi:hypothetical protein